MLTEGTRIFISMSAKGSLYDNVFIGSFFKTLKAEEYTSGNMRHTLIQLIESHILLRIYLLKINPMILV